MPRLDFKLDAEADGSKARAATFTTLHGKVQTPVFMPVGTQATVKSQTRDSLKTVGSSVLLANTYHLLLRPGVEVFKKFGGIHRFMHWDGPVLTDSGGFQIFSLPHSRKLNEEGARFQSYVDGASILLTPELSIQTQKAIGSDIMMVLDQCIPSTAERTQAKAAMELTHRWAVRSLNARGDSNQSMFGIVQGACFPDLRKQSADYLTTLPFDGFAVGGLAVGESKAEREDFTELTASMLPKNLPRYLMGVGTPLDILEAVHRGIDMFDCILPSQLAQRGVVFTSQGKLQLRRSVYKLSEQSIDPSCICNTCAHYSRAYLHHLIKSDEVLGWHLLALHNLTFYHQLMKEMRARILENRFIEYYHEKRCTLGQTDEENPSVTKTKKPSKKEKNLRLGNYEIVKSERGFASIKHVSSGEIMHSVNPPEEEARNLYIQPSSLVERFQKKPELIIWDVGLGAATNAMLLLREFEAIQKSGAHTNISIKLYSFENDLDSLKLALKNPSLFPHIQHQSPHAIIENQKWKNAAGSFTWELVFGDFLETLTTAPAPDLIYFDPFSYKTDSLLWTAETFGKIFSHCKHKPMKLITYSSSTKVRAALLSKSFYVGIGANTGPKTETTIAFTNSSEAKDSKLLGKEWLARWARSESRDPALDAIICSHPQFQP